mmetsp:Transcript_145512/g.369200  ORF Transcript_145512/g.369200 Transcript_145512/m.369200 type:complete len:338 (-) Transcript_145512:1113-2126(-)
MRADACALTSSSAPSGLPPPAAAGAAAAAAAATTWAAACGAAACGDAACACEDVDGVSGGDDAAALGETVEPVEGEAVEPVDGFAGLLGGWRRPLPEPVCVSEAFLTLKRFSFAALAAPADEAPALAAGLCSPPSPGGAREADESCPDEFCFLRPPVLDGRRAAPLLLAPLLSGAACVAAGSAAPPRVAAALAARRLLLLPGGLVPLVVVAVGGSGGIFFGAFSFGLPLAVAAGSRRPSFDKDLRAFPNAPEEPARPEMRALKTELRSETWWGHTSGRDSVWRRIWVPSSALRMRKMTYASFEMMCRSDIALTRSSSKWCHSPPALAVALEILQYAV